MSASNIKTVLKTFGLSLLLAIAIQTKCIAGGSSWEVRIEKMQQQSPNHATVVLNTLEDEAFYKSCAKLLIEIDWQPDYLRRGRKLDFDREVTALKKHQEALISLQRAYMRRSSTRIGEMMGGLIHIQSNKSWLDCLIQFFSRLFGKIDPPSLDSSIPIACQFNAFGLEIFEEDTNERVVYVLNDL